MHNNNYWLGTTASPQESLAKAIELLQKSLSIEDSNVWARGWLSQLYTMNREYDKGIAEGERVMAISPSSAGALYFYALSLNYAGRCEEAIPLLQKASRLDPFGRFHYQQLGHALRCTGRFEEAVSAYQKSLQRRPNDIYSHLNLATAYSLVGREKEARAEAEEVLKINPKFSLDWFQKTLIWKEQSQNDQIINALRNAGLK